MIYILIWELYWNYVKNSGKIDYYIMLIKYFNIDFFIYFILVILYIGLRYYFVVCGFFFMILLISILIFGYYYLGRCMLKIFFEIIYILYFS